MSDKFPGGFLTAGAPAGFSVAFDGTSNSYLTAPDNTAFDIGSGDFVVECWVYLTATTDYGVLLGQWGIPRGYALRQRAGKISFVYSTNGTNETELSSTTSYALNTWYYVAAVRTSNTLGLFINSTREASASMSGVTINNSTDIFSIGRAGNAADYTTGYISNARIIKGTVPTGYSATATTMNTPTQLFPVTNTSILTCQSPTIIDNSTNAFTITAGSSAKVSNFTPFAGYTGFNPALGAAAGGVWTLDEAAYYQNNRQWPIYDPYFKNTTLMLHGNGTNGAQNNTFLDSSTNNFTITRNGNTTQGTFTPFSQTGWSSWFDGTANTASITTPQNAAFNFGTGDFSVEAWVYATATQSVYPIVQLGYGAQVGGPYTGWAMNMVDLTSIQFYRYDGSETRYTFSVTIPQNTWVHVAVTRSSSSMRAFLNGVQIGAAQTATTSYNNVNSDPLIIGKAQGGSAMAFPGYISNVRIIKGSAVYTNSFTPSTQPLTAVTNTVLLACQNSRLVDNSANNFPFSTTGSTSVQAFSPFVPAYITPTTYSNWFDGSGDYLTASGANLALGAGNFTVEGWFYTTGYNTGEAIYSGLNTYPASTGLLFYINGSGTYTVDVNGSNIIASGTAPLNTWTHVALVRSSTGSNGLALYVNGVSIATGTTANDFTSTYAVIGRTGFGAASNFWLGCLSNIRVLVGTALYTANFTPPTAPLTAISGTQLLTCQSSTFVDNSTNNFTLTANGNVQPVTSPTPFPAKVDTTTLNSAYSTSLIGGSAYFDGSGDYLSFSGPTIGTGAFCLEAWVYCTSSFTNQTIFGADGTNNRISIKINNSTTISVDQYGVSASNFTVAAMALNAWNHIAVSRNGSSVATVFVNGVRSSTGTATLSNNYTTFNAIGRFDSGSGYYLTGYIAGARATIGSTPYDPTQTGFAVPYAPPTTITNTQFLTNFTNGAIFDNTAKNVLETVGTAAISTTQSKYGGSSMYFDGSTSCWLLVPFRPTLDLSTGAPDWTLECWGYVVSFANSPYFFNKGGVAASTYTNYAFSMNTSGVVFCTLGNNGGETSYSFGTCATNTWYHFAATRQGSTIRTFLNGVLVTSQSIATTMTDNGEALYVGCLKNLTSNVLNGYVDDLRITKGVARYVTNFTPPTSQLQDQ